MWVQIAAVCSLQDWIVVSAGCQRNVKAMSVLQVVSCNTLQKAQCPPKKRYPSMQQDNTEQQRADWSSTWRLRERERMLFYNTILAVIRQTCCPYCVRSPCSLPCKHPVWAPSWLYSDPEQEVISYPTSASVFLSQVVNAPGNQREWWRECKEHGLGWTWMVQYSVFIHILYILYFNL